jgi:hypothetical protein
LNETFLVLFSFNWLIIQIVKLPHTERSEFDEDTPDNLKCTEGKTDQVLGGVQWETFSDLSTNFNHCNLDNKGENGDKNEDAVSKDSSENVEFA